MALTAEVLLVNTEYLKSLTNLNGAVDDNLIVPSIILAQDKYLQQWLGTDLYKKIRNDVAGIDGGTITGAYEVLLNQYIRKVVCWWTMVELTPALYVKLDNGQLAIRQGSNTAPISQADFNRELERSRQNAQFYTQRLIDYLCHNTSLYPEYTSNTSPDMQPQRQTYFQNGMTISHGHYPYSQEDLYWYQYFVTE